MAENIQKEGPWPLTYWGHCGHVRQEGLPCATPTCKEGASLSAHGFMRTMKTIDGVAHYLWLHVRNR